MVFYLLRHRNNSDALHELSRCMQVSLALRLQSSAPTDLAQIIRLAQVPEHSTKPRTHPRSNDNVLNWAFERTSATFHSLPRLHQDIARAMLRQNVHARMELPDNVVATAYQQVLASIHMSIGGAPATSSPAESTARLMLAARHWWNSRLRFPQALSRLAHWLELAAIHAQDFLFTAVSELLLSELLNR